MHNGPVPECLRLVHGKELPVSKGWKSRLPTCKPQASIARNYPFPEFGTPGSQPRNHGLPLQRPAGSQRLYLPVPNLKTKGSKRKDKELIDPNRGITGYRGRELPAPRRWNSWFPTWGLEVANAKNFQALSVGTGGSHAETQKMRLQGIAGSQRLDLHF